MIHQYDIKAYHFDLPEKNIAQTPWPRRDESRLLALDCRSDWIRHLCFKDILEFLNPGDLLIVNDTRVFPARLLGKKETGGYVELLILEYPREIRPIGESKSNSHAQTQYRVQVTGIIRSSKRPRPGNRLFFSECLEGVVLEIMPDGKVLVVLEYKGDFNILLESCGKTPLPPYIRRDLGDSDMDRERYQTVFARHPGAVAAPTAGLHFSEELLNRIRNKGVVIASVTLHIGYGTFSPVRVEDIREHRIHSEYFSVSKETADLINQTAANRGSVWAVGTTTARVLEFAADQNGKMQAKDGWCDLYIYPGYRFKLVRKMITNFHLPQSSLIFMVSALAGRERILSSYNEAVRKNYRFFSYGDAMAIIT